MRNIKIATPISHLFENLNNAKLIISNSDQFILWNPRELLYNFTSKNFGK